MKTYFTPEELAREIGKERKRITSLMRESELMEEHRLSLIKLDDPNMKEAIAELKIKSKKLRIMARNKMEKRIPALSKALAAIRTPSLFDGKLFSVKV